MNILAVDTAGKSAAVAILRDDTLLYETQCNNGMTHSETLLPMIDTALRACGLTMEDIDLTPAQLDLYAVTNGPGSFTGLRIGLSVVKGLALPRQIPCAGVSTMAALAYGLAGEGTVIGAQDARRGQVYWGAFDLATHTRLTEDAAAPVTSLEKFVQDCKKPLFFVGDGATLCYNSYKQVCGVAACPPALQVLRGAGVALAALWGGMQEGITTTRAGFAASMALLRKWMWPLWGGSNVPPYNRTFCTVPIILQKRRRRRFLSSFS